MKAETGFIRRPMEKPYDCFLLHRGLHYAFELKVMKKKTFNFGCIRRNQWDGLFNVWKNGGRSGVIVLFWLELVKSNNYRSEYHAFYLDYRGLESGRDVKILLTIADFKGEPKVIPLERIPMGERDNYLWDIRPIVERGV
jgi:hypothetical protein